MNTNDKPTLKEIEKLTPQKINQEKSFFAIPLYQRLFAWSTREVAQLMDDLIEHHQHKFDTPYYIGMISTVGNKEYYELIDGQQRFTMLMLLGICMQHLHEGWKEFVHKGERLKFVGREEDNEYLRILSSINNEGNKEPDYGNKKMKEAIEVIKTKLDTEFKSDEQGQKLFAANIYKHITVFNAVLPEHYQRVPAELNRYFEAMNSTGKSLEQHEVLKVNLLRTLPADADKPFYTRLWNTVAAMDKKLIGAKDDNDVAISKSYIEAINYCRVGDYHKAFQRCDRAKEKEDGEDTSTIDVIPVQEYKFNKNVRFDKEASIISFPELLLVTLNYMASAATGSKDKNAFRTDKLTEIFKEKRPDASQFFKTLLLVRLLLDMYVVRKEYTESNSFDYTLVVASAQPPNNKPNPLIKYMTMMDVSTSYTRWLVGYLKFVYENNGNITEEKLLTQLKADDRKLHPWPKGNLDEVLSYPTVRTKQYLFWRLEYLLWDKAKDVFDPLHGDIQAVHHYHFRSNRSVEHLHPQNEDYNDKWKIEDGDVVHPIHSFGNLALISPSFNSTQSNDPVHVKFARVEDQVRHHALQSLKLYHMYLMSNHGEWNQAIAAEHKRQMFNLLADSYDIEANERYWNTTEQAQDTLSQSVSSDLGE